MIGDNPNPSQEQAIFPADEAAAFELLDRLPASPEPRTWPSDSMIVEVLAIAETLKVTQQVEREDAANLARQVERHPESRARLLVVNQERFRTWGLAEELIARSRRSIFDADPCRAVRLGRLAVCVADHLCPSVYGASLVADLRARAWAHLGNSYRCAGQIGAATRALERAEELLLEGTGDPLEEASLRTIWGSLESASGHYERAMGLIEAACSIYESIGETELRGRALVQLSVPVGMSDPKRGVDVAQQAEKIIDPEQDPWLFLAVRHNHIRCLIDSGEPERAAMLLTASRKLYRELGRSWDQINLAWLEARLSAALGDLEGADAAFEVVLSEMLERGYQLDGALVALDLAACRLAQGRLREAADLAAKMGGTIREWGVHARARDAWALLQQALRVEKATVGLVREVSAYLQRCWRNPELPLPRTLRHQRELLGGT